MKLYVKELLILFYLLSGSRVFVQRAAELGWSVGLVFYLGLFGLLTACIVAAAYVRHRPARWTYGVLLFASALFLSAIEAATARDLSYDMFINMWNSSGFAEDALRQYQEALLLGLLGALPLLIGIVLEPRRRAPLPGYALATAPLAGMALLAAILFARGGDGARGLPGAFTPIAYAALLAYETGIGPHEARHAVSIPLVSAPLRRDIVLIVDESVLGSYLDLNAAGGVRSGLLERRPGIAIHNFGYAASITNCSVGSNLTLRHGGTRGDYQRINATMPSIWAYARRAGFRTVYIDAQTTGGRRQNLMDDGERAEIDEFVQFDGVAVRDRDMAAADRLIPLLGNDRRDFVLVNKVGAHFPVHDKYPDSYMRYSPALPRGHFEDISDTGSRRGFGGGADDWRRYRNAYRNTLLWNVGAFFNRLLGHADLSRATIIYTSDHGQDLHERGTPGVTTHCSSDPVEEEGMVPLVVVEGSGASSLDWTANLDANRDGSSDYDIFPTLLDLLGYDRAKVEAVYGKSLAERTDDDFTFNSRFYARLGKQPVWRRIHLPPAAAARSREEGGPGEGRAPAHLR